MLVLNDSSDLGDKKLNPEEGLAKLKERNRAITDRQKIVGQSELEDIERSAGPKMPYQELIRKLQKLNFNLKVRDGSPGNIAFYDLKTQLEVEQSYNEDHNDFSRSEWFKAHKYITGCPKEPLPEYSTVTVDERGRPHRELRGWRSILISMVKNGVITYQQAEEEFGPAMGKRSWRFEEQLQGFRN
jgi:hypothetical protein